MKRGRKNLARGKYITLGLAVVFVIILVGSNIAMETYTLGDNFSFNIDWSNIRDDTIGVIYGDGLEGANSEAEVLAGTNEIRFIADTVAPNPSDGSDRRNMPTAGVSMSFGDMKFVTNVGGTDIVSDITGIPVPYSTTTAGGYVYENYKVRFLIRVVTFSSVTKISSPISYTTGDVQTIDIDYIPSTRVQRLNVDMSMATLASADVPSDTTFKIMDIDIIDTDAQYAQLLRKQTTSVISADGSYAYELLVFDSYVGESYPHDVPLLTDYEVIGGSHDIPAGNTAGVDNAIFTLDFDIAPGAAYIDNNWYMRDIEMNIEAELELQIVHNEYDDAKWTFLDGLIAVLPKRITYGDIQANILWYLVVLGAFVISLAVVYWYSRTYTQKISG